MIDRLKQKRNEQGGFTLIELLIVVIVLAILAAIVVFALGTTRSDSVHSACATSEKSLELSAEAINTKTGAYPAAVAPGLTVVANTANNPLVVTPPGTPSNGALLKAFPASTDYSLQYVGTADASGNTTFVVNVFSRADTNQTTFVPNAGATPVTGGCSKL
jgi:prepilin-type N-terminal cleavage/methylation domain-containing protein